jgi:hypothetical protein
LGVFPDGPIARSFLHNLEATSRIAKYGAAAFLLRAAIE